MAKPTPTPERVALIAAHQNLAEAQRALQQAEDAHRQALRAYGDASDTEEIDGRIRALKAEPTYGMWELRAQRNEKLSAAYAAREYVERQAYPLKLEEERARARIAEAERPVAAAHDHLGRAAAAVVAAEAVPVARQHLDRCMDALATLLAHSPDLVVMVDKDILPPELAREIEGAAGGLLMKARGWQAFEGRYRTSPWRSAKEQLQTDPSAPLPSVPVP